MAVETFLLLAVRDTAISAIMTNDEIASSTSNTLALNKELYEKNQSLLEANIKYDKANINLVNAIKNYCPAISSNIYKEE
jgi:hypothetical protein